MRREGGKRESERLTLTRKQLRVLEMRVEKNSTLEPHDRKLGRELVPNIVWISDRCLVHNVSGSVIDVFVHHVYYTLTVAGLEQGLLWVGSFSLPALPEPRLNYLEGRKKELSCRERFCCHQFSAECISGQGPLTRFRTIMLLLESSNWTSTNLRGSARRQ